MTATAQQDLPPTNTASERRMLTKAQVAARLGCSERSLERLVKQGRFPAPRRYGRAVVWFEAAVEHVLELAEQEQLQWLPPATPVEEVASTAVQQFEPSLPSLIPDAHELELEASSPAVRKSHKGQSATKRRERTGASASDLAALQQVFNLPTV